jgi:acyl-CoA thioester hydrolase
MSLDTKKYFHTQTIQIRFNDIDTLGHATNSVYQQYFDLGRMAYFKDVLKDVMDWQEEGLILVNISINYLNPIKIYDNVEVLTKIVRLGNKSLEMVQQIYNQTSSNVAAESKAVMVGFNGKNEQSIPIPTRWRERIVSFEKDIKFDL